MRETIKGTEDLSERLEAAALGLVSAHNDESGGAVVQLRSVRSGNGTYNKELVDER